MQPSYEQAGTSSNARSDPEQWSCLLRRAASSSGPVAASTPSGTGMSSPSPLMPASSNSPVIHSPQQFHRCMTTSAKLTPAERARATSTPSGTGLRSMTPTTPTAPARRVIQSPQTDRGFTYNEQLPPSVHRPAGACHGSTTSGSVTVPASPRTPPRSTRPVIHSPQQQHRRMTTSARLTPAKRSRAAILSCGTNPRDGSGASTAGCASRDANSSTVRARTAPLWAGPCNLRSVTGIGNGESISVEYPLRFLCLSPRPALVTDSDNIARAGADADNDDRGGMKSESDSRVVINLDNDDGAIAYEIDRSLPSAETDDWDRRIRSRTEIKGPWSRWGRIRLPTACGSPLIVPPAGQTGTNRRKSRTRVSRNRKPSRAQRTMSRFSTFPHRRQLQRWPCARGHWWGVHRTRAHRRQCDFARNASAGPRKGARQRHREPPLMRRPRSRVPNLLRTRTITARVPRRSPGWAMGLS